MKRWQYPLLPLDFVAAPFGGPLVAAPPALQTPLFPLGPLLFYTLLLLLLQFWFWDRFLAPPFWVTLLGGVVIAFVSTLLPLPTLLGYHCILGLWPRLHYPLKLLLWVEFLASSQGTLLIDGQLPNRPRKEIGTLLLQRR